MGHLRQRGNKGNWKAIFKDGNGKFVERTTKTNNLKEAQEILAEWEKAARKARRGELTQAQVMKVMSELVLASSGEKMERESTRDFFTRWLRGKETRRGRSTIKRYKPILEGFLDSLAERRADAIIGSVSAREVAKYIEEQIKQGKSYNTADLHLNVLSSVFRAAVKEGLAIVNPADAVERFDRPAEERIPFTDEQVRQLLSAANDEWYGMVVLSYHIGIRIRDCANLVHQNIDFEAQSLTFIESKTASRKKTQSPETTVYLHEEAFQWLKNRPAGVGMAPLFPSFHGRSTGSAGGLSNAFKRLMGDAGIVVPLGDKKEGKGRQFRKLGFHSLRHTFISRLANSDVSVDVRKAMAGHSSDEIHRRYTHLDLSTQAAAVNRLPGILVN
ncbi:MAG: site-specific integrase [Verrucomicrobia bacterium]|nr:site-specific integrase [Verrucomicrobiota bacterium]